MCTETLTNVNKKNSGITTKVNNRSTTQVEMDHVMMLPITLIMDKCVVEKTHKNYGVCTWESAND